MLASLFFAIFSCVTPTGPAATSTPEAAVPGLNYPDSPRGEVQDAFYGVDVPDPYRWLEDMNSAQTQDWISAQNALTAQHMAGIGEHATILERLTKQWDYPKFGVPDQRGGVRLASYNSGQLPQSVLRLNDPESGETRVLLDPLTLDPDGTTAIIGSALSPAGDQALVMLSERGSDWRTLVVYDVQTGALLEDRVEWCKFTWPEWNADGTGFWYARYDAPTEEGAALSHHKLYFHRIGTPQAEDRLEIARDDQPNWGFGAHPSEDGATLYAEVWSGTAERQQLWVRDADAHGEPFTPVFGDFEAERQWIGAREQTVWILTDVDAPNRRLVAVDRNAPDPGHWTDVAPETEHAILSAHRIGGRFVVHRIADAVSVLEVWGEDGALQGRFELPQFATVQALRGHADAAEFHVSLGSFLMPTTVFRGHVETRELVPEQTIELAVDTSAFLTEQVFATSRDGTSVPLFITRRADIEPTGDHPTLLYGYGGFNNAVQPSFRVSVLTWLEMGGIFVSANLRGGSEYGHPWHEAGTLTQKQNVFDDFIGAAEHLIATGWTRPDRLAIQGRSNGGLLVGATVIQRPDLFGAALPSVGVMDMLRYHRFTIGWAWASDYGTVDDGPEMFQALLAYSPVHNARPNRYPAILITTADHDDRVVPLHSYKFAAAMQHAQQGPAPILLRVDTGAGHGAGRSTSREQAEWADRLSFLVRALNMEPTWSD